MGFRGYLLTVILVIFPTDAGGTCALDESSSSARCYSLKEIEELIPRANDVRILEVNCSQLEGIFDFSDFQNLSSLSIEKCSNVEDLIGKGNVTDNLKRLNLPSNNISILPWQLFARSSITTLDISRNTLKCDCKNYWVWEYLKRDKTFSGWDPHFVVGFPQNIIVDENFLSCNFTGCTKEEVEAVFQPKNLTLGQDLKISCKIKSTSKDKNVNGEWIWLLRDETGDDSPHGRSLTEGDMMTLEIENLTSHELGYAACICQECDRPVFDVIEVSFESVFKFKVIFISI